MSQITYNGESLSRLSDNDIALINQIISIIVYSDPNYRIEIFKKDTELIGHIHVSDPSFKQCIIDNLLFINRMLKIKIKYSSSLKISTLVSFKISL